MTTGPRPGAHPDYLGDPMFDHITAWPDPQARDPHERPPRGRHRATAATPPAHRAAHLIRAARGGSR